MSRGGRRSGSAAGSVGNVGQWFATRFGAAELLRVLGLFNKEVFKRNMEYGLSTVPGTWQLRPPPPPPIKGWVFFFILLFRL